MASRIVGAREYHPKMGWRSTSWSRWLFVGGLSLVLYVGFPVVLIGANAAIDSARAGWPGGLGGWLSSTGVGTDMYLRMALALLGGLVVVGLPAAVVSLAVRRRPVGTSGSPALHEAAAFVAALAGAYVAWFELIQWWRSPEGFVSLVSLTLGVGLSLLGVAYLVQPRDLRR